jgi:Fe-S-cluster-containing dehydrogenase component
MTELSRRQLLTSGCVGVAAAAAPTEAMAGIARPPKEMPPNAVGLLYDSTLCIGCKACVGACKAANNMPDGDDDDLSAITLSAIKMYSNGTAEKKDSAIDGYAFVQRHCLHCVDPTCVSVCPVAAMRKDPATGIVSYDPDACIGCRYCLYACPFGVPRFEFNNPFGKVTKCQLCRDRQKEGKIPACADACPTGATLFGSVTDLEQEAARRLAAEPGTPYTFHRGRLGVDDRPPNEATIPTYVKAVYGQHEAGGTQYRSLAGISFSLLGLPSLPSQSPAALSEGLQHKIYHWLILPVVAFAGLLMLVRSRVKDAHPKS